jgi:zinc transport system substrate-binding protein
VTTAAKPTSTPMGDLPRVHSRSFAADSPAFAFRRAASRWGWVCALVLPLLIGCRPAVQSAAKIAAANSYLEAAVQDLLGHDTPVLRLAEPGSCPGHFDLRPSQVLALRDSRWLFRFEFQSGLDEKLTPLSEGGLEVLSVRVPGGMGVSTSYLSVCRQLCAALVASGGWSGDQLDLRLQAITRRVETLTIHSRNAVAAVGKPAVLASGRQAEFCEWLGLEVAGQFTAAEVARLSAIEAALQAGRRSGVKLVIANRPEGLRVAEALAEALDARLVVFDNFPNPNCGGPAYDAMVRANVERLLEALP